ncbi:envelope stress response membrane protein PspC [Colwellia sp. RE-S-Sl-9]
MSIKGKGELFRDPDNGKVAGVCAGLANYFGWEAWLVRVLVASGTLLGMSWFIVIYIAGWFILDKKPKQSKSFKQTGNTSTNSTTSGEDRNSDLANESIKVKAKVWQAGEPPKQAFHDIKRKFTLLEGQLRAMERYVTSPEFTVSREINKL